MAQMTVSLPDPLKEWVEVQARIGDYADESDYVRALIRRDRERTDALAELQRLVAEGLDSGISDRSMDDLETEARRQPEAANGG